METKALPDAYVKALQKAVETGAKSRDAFASQLQEAERQLGGGLPKGGKKGLKLRTDHPTSREGAPALRVTCPTRTVVAAECDPSLNVRWAEFYLTRVGPDGSAETRPLGSTKYRDGHGRWSLAFQTERFARQPTDPLVIHAELFDETGSLLAARAVGAVV